MSLSTQTWTNGILSLLSGPGGVSGVYEYQGSLEQIRRQTLYFFVHSLCSGVTFIVFVVVFTGDFYDYFLKLLCFIEVNLKSLCAW